MLPDEKHKAFCSSLEETKQLAHKLAASLKGGEVVELASDLGGGKTTFVKFVVEALGSQDDVSSPSFTIENIYKTKDFTVHHFDFYRLEEAGIMGHELDEVLGDTGIVTFVEWAGIVDDVLPEDRLKINIKSTGEQSRDIMFTASPSAARLLKGLQA